MSEPRLKFALVRSLGIVGVLLVLWVTLPGLLHVKGIRFWTDDLIFVLLSSLIVFITYIRHTEHLLAPWREIFRRKLAMIALIVLGMYICVGLLDSIHFRKPIETPANAQSVNYSVEVLSVLDEILTPLRTHVEETYSAPFATHSYSMKMMVSATGSPERAYPRLRYGGAHLKNIEDKDRDIVRISLQGILYAILGWAILITLLTQSVARSAQLTFAKTWRAIWRAQTDIPWRVISLTVLVILLLVTPVALLSTQYHVFGTDKVGMDVLYWSIKSIRTGLVIGTLTTLIMLPFAVMLGIMAGYYRGWVDDVIQYVYTTLSSIPSILLIAAAILTTQVFIEIHPQSFETVYDVSDLRLLALCAILGITSWTSLCRLLRGETLKLREMDYIQAATAFGVHNMKIITRHILPNVMHIVLIVMVLDFSGLVLAESVLSYIGIGVDQSTMSWGNMINNARMELAREPMVWWSLCAAFIMMFILVLAANLFADAVRDAFDPRLKQVLKKAGAK